MTANTTPIFTGTPAISWATADGNGGTNGPLKTANTNMDGTGTVTTVFTAGANGSYVQRIVARPAGSCTASVLRVFINNGSASSTNTNNVLFTEVSLPLTTANAAAALQDIEVPLNFALPASYVINVTLGTTVSAGWAVSLIGGNY